MARTSSFRASIVGRARFIEDLLEEQARLGLTQYVLLGAGLDTFAQRRPELASRLRVFLVPFEAAHAGSQQGFKQAAAGAQQSGTPFLSFFKPAEMLKLASEAGFRATQHMTPADLTQRYFANRPDGLRPPDNAEEILVAKT